MIPLHIIAAMSENRVIAQNGRIPWHLPDDIQHFRAQCAGRWLLLGRETWEQMQGWFQLDHHPLVLSHRALTPGSGIRVASIPQARSLAADGGADRLMVLGGGQVFAAALPVASEVWLTTVRAIFQGQVHFPTLDDDWLLGGSENHPADARHAYSFTIERYIHRIPPCLSSVPVD